MYVCYIDANSLGTPKQGDTGKLDLLQFSLPEINGIQKIVSAKDIFGLIVKSICPSIYGNHLVKAGLALTMFR
jgi:DNA replicative helicase MCM subunit Mcm2 (Cdc46/Mcm family)